MTSDLTFYWPLIREIATSFSIDPALVGAIVLQESGARTDAFRFEPLFWARYLSKKPEWKSCNPRRISASYGLMQIMYPVAVERGYQRKWLPESLFAPDAGLEWGCRQLMHLETRLTEKAPLATPEDALLALLASYNGGFQMPGALRPDNTRYALQVRQRYLALRDELQWPSPPLWTEVKA